MERFNLSRNIELNIRQETVRLFMERCPISHPDLVSVTLGGSTSEGSDGKRSDIDITTVMNPENPEKVDVDAIITIGRQIQDSVRSLSVPGIIQPIIISTIRLEEAQAALSELTGTSVLPIHWLHYPSIEFAKVNEPPELFCGLVLNGNPLLGNSKSVVEKFKKMDISELNFLSGLDWLTDSLKVLIANTAWRENDSNFQPRSFSIALATHNLEYFWKWRIISNIIRGSTGKQIRGWADAEANSQIIRPEIWELARHVRNTRHKSPDVGLQEIIDLHKETFKLWPI